MFFCRYYHSKKQENYKQLLRKSRHGRTRSSRNNPNAKVNTTAASATALVDAVLSTTGVTTRLQREQLQKQEPKETTNHVILSDSLMCSSGSSTIMMTTTTTTVVTSVNSSTVTFSNSNSSSANKEPEKEVNSGTTTPATSISTPASIAENKENTVKIRYVLIRKIREEDLIVGILINY